MVVLDEHIEWVENDIQNERKPRSFIFFEANAKIIPYFEN
jgi:hypothetical protein